MRKIGFLLVDFEKDRDRERRRRGMRGERRVLWYLWEDGVDGKRVNWGCVRCGWGFWILKFWRLRWGGYWKMSGVSGRNMDRPLGDGWSDDWVFPVGHQSVGIDACFDSSVMCKDKMGLEKTILDSTWRCHGPMWMRLLKHDMWALCGPARYNPGRHVGVLMGRARMGPICVQSLLGPDSDV